MKNYFKHIFCLSAAVLASSFLFVRCDSGDEFESDKKVKVKIDLGGEITQCAPQCVVVDENNPSNRYIRIDSVIQYGLGTDYMLPDSLKDCNLKIIASGRMRESDNFKGCIAFNLINNRDSLLLWTIIKSETHVRHLKSWINFKDSLVISKEVNKMSARTFRVFPYKNGGSGTFDIDNLVIEIIKE